MSYVSGFMMGAAIGKSLRQFVSGDPAKRAVPHFASPLPAGSAQAVRHSLHAAATKAAALPPSALSLVSRLPGRRRYRAPLTRAQAALLEQELSRLTFLKEVRVSAQTGSLLFLYDEKDEAKMDLVADFLRGSIFRPVAIARLEGALLPLEAHAGALTRSVRGTMRDFSAFIRRSTGGWLDVSSAAFLLFLLRGIRKMVLTQQFPSGAQMLWWAVSLMRGWRTV